MVNKFRASALVLFLFYTSQSASGQTSAPPAGKPSAPGLIKLTGEDEKRATQLDDKIDKAMQADRWDEAVAKAEELLAMRTRVQGPKHFETVSAEWNLKALRRAAPMPREDRVAYQSAKTRNHDAETLLAQGKYAQAQPLFDKALQIRRRLLGDDHPETAQSYNNAAVNLDAQGKHGLAQPLVEKALSIRQRLLTDNHPDTAESYDSVAGNLNAQGRYALAQPLYEKALEIRRRLFAEDHLATSTSLNNLAGNLDSQGMHAAAQALYEKALEIKRRLLGDDNPDTATGYDNLATNLGEQSKFVQAQALYAKGLAIRRKLLKDGHPDTAASFNNLGFALNSQGKYTEAQPLFETALAIYRRVLTDDHPDTANCYNNLAINLNAQGKYAQAQPLLEKALETYRRLLTDENPRTAYAYNNLGFNLNAQGKYGQAQLLYEKALEIYRRMVGDNHPGTARTYNNLAYNLSTQGKYAEAQPLYEKSLEIRRRLLTDNNPDTARTQSNVALNLDSQGKHAQAQPIHEQALSTRRRLLSDAHPDTAQSYKSTAANLAEQGKYAEAQPLFEKALEIYRRALTEDHPTTASTFDYLAQNLKAQGKYLEAKDRWTSAVKGLDAARLRIAFSGMERAAKSVSARRALAAALARLNRPAEAWQSFEEDLGRGLLDELAARQERRLTPAERARLRELTGELERLDKLVEITPKGLDQFGRAKRFEELRHQRELASIALGELQTKLAETYGTLGGQVAGLSEIQAALPANAALVAWVDLPPLGPSAADPDGEHWGVVVRSRGTPTWVRLAGTGRNGLWTNDDTALSTRVRAAVCARPGNLRTDLWQELEKLRAERLAPLDAALGATPDGLRPVRSLILLPSRWMAGIPVEALLAPDDPRIVSYAPSATVFKYLRAQPRLGRHAGLLVLGDPIYARPDNSSDPARVPDHGLLVNVVKHGSNSAAPGLKEGDVLLAYNGQKLRTKDDLRLIDEKDKPIAVEIWRDGGSLRFEISPGELGVGFDTRPLPVALADRRKLQLVLVAARSGGGDFSPLPGTRHEVEVLSRLFESDDRVTLALLGADAGEPALDRLAAAGELEKFGFIHLAAHGLIDAAIPERSAVILTQTALPDPLEQALSHKPVFDGRLSVREIQRSWDLKAELVTLSACQTALGRESGGEGFVGFTQALLMSGARSVCLSLWKVDDKATSLLMTRFYQNMLGRRAGLSKPMPKAEALQEAKRWLRSLTVDQVDGELAALQRGEVRPLAKESGAPAINAPTSHKSTGIRPYNHPYFWAAFVLVGDPD